MSDILERARAWLGRWVKQPIIEEPEILVRDLVAEVAQLETNNIILAERMMEAGQGRDALRAEVERLERERAEAVDNAAEWEAEVERPQRLLDLTSREAGLIREEVGRLRSEVAYLRDMAKAYQADSSEFRAEVERLTGLLKWEHDNANTHFARVEALDGALEAERKKGNHVETVMAELRVTEAMHNEKHLRALRAERRVEALAGALRWIADPCGHHSHQEMFDRARAALVKEEP